MRVAQDLKGLEGSAYRKYLQPNTSDLQRLRNGYKRL